LGESPTSDTSIHDGVAGRMATTSKVELLGVSAG
jgi:hypothetical protein